MADDDVAAHALAGGCLSATILDALHSKGILTRSEARTILQNTLMALKPSLSTPAGHQAAQIIASLLEGPYAARISLVDI